MVTSNPSPPAVVLFLEGTSRSVEVLRRIVSGLQRGGRRVYVFAGSGQSGSPRVSTASPPAGPARRI